jgi:hypothetical protein
MARRFLHARTSHRDNTDATELRNDGGDERSDLVRSLWTVVVVGSAVAAGSCPVRGAMSQPLVRRPPGSTPCPDAASIAVPRFPPRRDRRHLSSRVPAISVLRTWNDARTHGSPRRQRPAVLEQPHPGQGSRGAPFGVHRPAIRARIPRMRGALRLRWLVQARRSGMQGTSLPRVSLQAQIPHRFFVLTSAARSARERPMLSTRRRSPAAQR